VGVSVMCAILLKIQLPNRASVVRYIEDHFRQFNYLTSLSDFRQVLAIAVSQQWLLITVIMCHRGRKYKVSINVRLLTAVFITSSALYVCKSCFSVEKVSVFLSLTDSD